VAVDPDGRRDRIEAMMSPPPPTLPAIGSLSVDAVGNLWVRRYYVPADTTHEWWIYDASGRLVAQITNRTRFRFTEIGADYVLGVYRDDDDVETIRRDALPKWRPASRQAASPRQAPGGPRDGATPSRALTNRAEHPQ
jgi:hypothetical protein